MDKIWTQVPSSNFPALSFSVLFFIGLNFKKFQSNLLHDEIFMNYMLITNSWCKINGNSTTSKVIIIGGAQTYINTELMILKGH